VKQKAYGFSIVELVIILTVISGIVLAGMVVFNKKNPVNNSAGSTTNSSQTSKQTKNSTIDVNNPPKLLEAQVFELGNFKNISKFRSGVGHDFSHGTGESCRSMKHYFNPIINTITNEASIPKTVEPGDGIAVNSPVGGDITKLESEQFPLGKQIYIVPEEYPDFTIRLFHIYPLSNISAGTKVKAGQRIGTLLKTQGTDIAVEVSANNKYNLISYFDIMPDSLFADFEKHGVADRKDLVITKADRDAKPLSCQGQQFSSGAEGSDSDYVPLMGYKP